MSQDMLISQRPAAEQWALAFCRVTGGIGACVFGAWVSSGVSGGAGIWLWLGVSLVLALAVGWSAGPAVELGKRFVRCGRGCTAAARASRQHRWPG